MCPPVMNSIAHIHCIFVLPTVHWVRHMETREVFLYLPSKDLDLDADAPSRKRARTGEEDTDFSMASLARGETAEVGLIASFPGFPRFLYYRSGNEAWDDSRSHYHNNDRVASANCSKAGSHPL